MFRTSLRPFYIMGSLIVALLIVTAGAGLLDPGMYRPFIKTDALFVGLLVQDAASLLAALLLAAAMYFAARGSVRALVTWCGLLAYVAYYYAFYCFGYTYTVFYPLYLALMGLAGYSLAGLLSAVDATVFARHAGPGLPVRLVAGVLGLTVLFIPLWLMQIAQGVRTQQVTETALVFVLDLSVLIPAALYAAVQIWRRRPQGYLVGGVMIFKAAASGILLTGGSIRQIVLGYTVGPDFGMYIFLAVVGSVALALYMRNLQVAPTTPAPFAHATDHSAAHSTAACCHARSQPDASCDCCPFAVDFRPCLGGGLSAGRARRAGAALCPGQTGRRAAVGLSVQGGAPDDQR